MMSRLYERLVWLLELLPYAIRHTGYKARSRHELANHATAVRTLEIAKAQGIRSPRTIIDVGCRDGDFSCWWHRAFPKARVIAVDMDECFPSFADFKITTKLTSDNTLDDRLDVRSLMQPIWIKVDVEEYTLDALKGAAELLRNAECVQVEVWGGVGDSEDFIGQPMGVFAFMAEQGFVCRCVSAGWLVKRPYSTTDWLFWRKAK